MEAICLISESCLGVGVLNFNILLQTSSSKSSSSLQKIKKSFQQVDTKCLRLALFTLIINTKQECDYVIYLKAFTCIICQWSKGLMTVVEILVLSTLITKQYYKITTHKSSDHTEDVYDSYAFRKQP